MGYRGLLLNDPYKRDRIDGVCMWITFYFVSLLFFVFWFYGGYMNQGIFWGGDLKMGATRVLRGIKGLRKGRFKQPINTYPRSS
jgi:hypothetical protein